MEPNQTNESNDKYTNYTYSAPDDSMTYTSSHVNPSYESNASQFAQSQYQSEPYQNDPYQNQQYGQNQYQNQQYGQNQYQNQQYGQPTYGSSPVYNAPQYNYQQSQNIQYVSNGTSIASMICGIVSIVFSCCYGLGIIPAIIALVLQGKFVTANNGATNGMAKAGKVCGIIGIVFNAIMLLIFIIAIMAEISA